jgi:cyclic pyranopterin phosphate synthase
MQDVLTQDTADAFGRPLRDLRISVIDRCNFRCTYCMPLDEYPWTPMAQILTFDEIERLAGIFVGLGVQKIRITGGEPLLRANVEELVGRLSRIDGLRELCLTTNGSLLAEKASMLKDAGLKRINVSIDTLDPERFAQIRRRGELDRVLDGLFAAQKAGIDEVKINCVVERGMNEDDILPLVEFGRQHGFEVRFIEFMDVGNANDWRSEKVLPKREIVERIAARYPVREVGRALGTAPAVDYEFVDGRGRVGVIASVTEPFCGSCTRARLTADGKLVTCLFSDIGRDIRGPLRAGATDVELTGLIAGNWHVRTDRYSEERLAALANGHGYEAREHRKIEMITLGG